MGSHRPTGEKMSTRTIKDATKSLQAHFSGAKLPLSLPTEARRMLQNYVDEHDEDLDEEKSAEANTELKNFWERFVGDSPSKSGIFVGVLKELRPIILRETDILEWWQLVMKPVISGTAHRKAVLEDAQDFLVNCMVHDENDEDGPARARTSSRLLKDLLDTYIIRTRGLTEEDPFIAPENAQVAQQVESVVVAFGRRQPKQLFHSLDDLVRVASTRLQALTLLSSFLRHQTAHLYLVINTPLIEDLLKCLMNDTSTTVLSVALTSLIMLLPHIPGSLGPHLPRLFLVYSRLLCWEKFSPLSTEAQKSLVTDDRVFTGSEADPGDVGIDQSWEKVRPREGMIETTTPELKTYFTYLYGLYPLNFMSYVRKPRRFLKDHEFLGAEDFDLDRAVIRSRTEQFSQLHLCHPNIYNLTIEEELIDPKWPKADPADVVADCHSLCINGKPALVSRGPPPTSKLPEVPSMPSLAHDGRSGQVSPSASHASFRSGDSWRDAHSTAMSARVGDIDSPVLRPHGRPLEECPQSSKNSIASRSSPIINDLNKPGSATPPRSPKNREDVPQSNIAHLQRENTLLRNDLNFERWHKAQYSQHIGQLARKNVKDATAEAETLNLINANRTLKMQLEQLRNARESTLKDSALTRKQANMTEAKMAERFANIRKEQEQWRADAEELRRLRNEMEQYRELLVTTEARELNKSHALEVVKRELEQMESIQRQLREAQRKLQEYEYRQFEMDRAKREHEVWQKERNALLKRVQGYQEDDGLTRHAHADKVAELEAQLETLQLFDHREIKQQSSSDIQVVVKQAIADSQAKLAHLKKRHNALLEQHTELELEYESVKSQLDAQGGGKATAVYGSNGLDAMSGGLGYNGSVYDTLSGYNAASESVYTTSTSDPTSRRYQPPMRALPVSSPRSEATLHNAVGLTWKSQIGRQGSLASRSSGIPATTYNRTTPLSAEESIRGSVQSRFSEGSSNGARSGKDGSRPISHIRLRGRGGLQKMKLKTEDEEDKPKGGLGSVFR